MKFRESRFDASGRVVIAIVAVAALIIIGMIVARLFRTTGLV